MSSVRGGTGRGRATFTQPNPMDGVRQPRPGFQTRGRGQSSVARGATARDGAVQRGGRPRAAVNVTRPKTPQPTVPGGDPQARFQALKKLREEERKEAIRNGFLADPDKPRTLAEAITPVGTCPDMCAEFERIERIVQKDVWAQEQDDRGEADEARMVKKFRRAAAGIDEQLPSDLRPPSTLKKTCDYLFDDLIGNVDSLGSVHHFIWDRTRAIRNDFSIQQITKPSDVQIAIECYERIARFHILSLHHFAIPDKPHEKYDWYQDREQLDRTLLSLMQYYDDNRGRVEMKNEAEFRAYCVVLQIHDPIPDLEERVSCYPPEVRSHPRVRVALDLYAAACNILDSQGPLKPKAPFPVGKEDWNGFFTKVESSQVSYLMACAAEIYFNTVRKQMLNNIWRSYSRQGSSADITDFLLPHLAQMFRFDDEEQARTFCEHYGFGFKETADGQNEFLDIHSVQGRVFPEATQGLPTQIFTQYVVEKKRLSRSFAAIIRGYNVAEATRVGMLAAEVGEDQDMAMEADQDSLFVPMSAPVPVKPTAPIAKSPFAGFGSTPTAGTTPSVNPFAQAGPTIQASTSTTPKTSPFAQKSAGLGESMFAPGGNSPGKSATGGWGQTTTSVWGQPSAEPAKPSFSGWGTTATSAASTASTSTAPFTAAKTSIHAPPAGWGKPVTASWNPPSPAKPEPPDAGAAAPRGPVSASVFGQPSVSNQGSAAESILSKQAVNEPSQVPAAESIFAKPAAVQQNASAATSIFPNPPAGQQKMPTFSFANTSTTPATQGKTESSPFTFGAPSAATAPTLQEKAPAFSFGPSVLSAPITKQGEKAPAFSFTKPGGTASSTANGAPEAKETLQTRDESASPKSVSRFGTPAEVQTPAESTTVKKPMFSFGQPTVQPTEDTSLSSGSTEPQTDQQASQRTDRSPSPSQTTTTSKSTGLGLSQPNQPKKRSPLSQSYSAEEDQSKPASPASSINFDTPNKNPFAFPSTTPQTTPQPPLTKQTIPPPAVKKGNLGDILHKLATEIVTDPDRGLLRQFVEYHARPAIMSVYEQLYLEEMRGIADNFRQDKLAKKYGRRWREESWRRHLARQGREKREKRRTTRRERTVADDVRKRRREENAVDDFLHRQSIRRLNGSVNVNSAAGHPRPTAEMSPRSSVASSVAESHAETAEKTAPAVTTSTKKPAETQQRTEFAKPFTPASKTDAAHRSSHFLGFSVPKQRSTLRSSAATPRQNSRSAYFRMKALGLDPANGAVSTPMAPPPFVNIRKRSRDEDEDEFAAASPPPQKSRTPPQISFDSSHARRRGDSRASQSSVLELSPRAPSTASRALSRTGADDEELFARARAARQALRQSTKSQHTPLHPPPASGELAAVDATPSASLQRARIQARFRAAERAENSLARSTRTIDVPAYRLRESRFVPREHYGRAAERARETIERRLRPASAIDMYDDTVSSVEKQQPEDEVRAQVNESVASSAPEHTMFAETVTNAFAEENQEPPLDARDSSAPYAQEHHPAQNAPFAAPSGGWASFGGDTSHLATFAGQIDENSPRQMQHTTAPYVEEPTPAENQKPSVPGSLWSFSHLNETSGPSPSRDNEPFAESAQTQTSERHLTSFESYRPLAGSFADLAEAAQKISESPYLGLGQDFAAQLVDGVPETAQPSMYPDLSGSIHYEAPPYDQVPLDPDLDMQQNRAFDIAVDQALATDDPLQRHTEADTGGYVQEYQPEHGSFITSHESAREDGHIQIDPNLLEPSFDPIASPTTANIEEFISARPSIPSPSPPPPQKAAIASNNPFAALAEESEAESVASSSSLASSADAPVSDEEDESEAVPTRQLDDDHFIPNGALQDAPVTKHGGLSFDTNTLTPAAVSDGPARHTRSRSRELQAVQQRQSVSREGSIVSQFGSVRAGSATPSRSLETGGARYSLRSEPIEEVEESGEESGEDDGEANVVRAEARSTMQRRDLSDGSEEDEDEDEDEESVDGEEEELDDEDADAVNGTGLHPASRPEGSVSDQHTRTEHVGNEKLGPVDWDEQEQESVEGYESEEGGFDSQDGEEVDGDEGDYDSEDEEEYDSDEDGAQQQQQQHRGLTPGQMQDAGTIKGGTGQSAEDAFELSD